MYNILFVLTICSPIYLLSQQVASWSAEKIEVSNDASTATLLHAGKIFQDCWDTLPQPTFWKKIMRLSPDSCLVNIASNRCVIAKMTVKEWNAQSEEQKTIVKDSLRQLYGVSLSEKINVTTGKKDFYRFSDVYPTISKGIEVFEENNVDPWYAQAILLIESPGQLKKSSVGAYGAFQLMPDVARANGLVVNESMDERANFERSAYAASRLIKRVCIPEAKAILSQYDIPYDESALWFRLFVLHVYHAGSNNVRAVISKIGSKSGSKELITQMWQTSAAGFGNNSQNYTQLALAAQLILNEMIDANMARSISKKE
jgi:hypothetical protein